MANSNQPKGYDGRRRASLPAMRLHAPVLHPRGSSPNPNRRKNDVKGSSSKSKLSSSDILAGSSDIKSPISTNIPRRKLSIPEVDIATNSPRRISPNDVSNLETKFRNANLKTPRQAGQKDLKVLSPRKTTIRKEAKHKENDDSPENSSDNSPSSDIIHPRCTRGRRHSVDVLMTSQKKPVTSYDDGTHKNWAAFCRVSDPKYFDADEYEKDCPHGTSLFQSVLADLRESSSEDDDNSYDVKPSQVQKKPTLKAMVNGNDSHIDGSENDRKLEAKQERRRQVRFRSNSFGDGL